MEYTAEELAELGQKGHAFRNADGTYSFPVANFEDLKRAINHLGRAAGHDAQRAWLIKRAVDLKSPDVVPDNWAADGALKDKRSWEERETANDMLTGLSGALDDALGDVFDDYYYCWVQDWAGNGDGDWPYVVIYYVHGDLYSAPFSFDADNKIVIDVTEAVKVRPVTTYVERKTERKPLIEWRKRKAGELRGLERRTFAATDVELRDNGDDTLTLVGYASVTDTPYEVGFYTETIKRGAFKRTLREDPDVQLLINHEGLPLARTKSGTLTLSEDDKGLRVEADLDPDDPDVQSLVRKMKRGDIDQMSFAFQPTDSVWNDTYTERTITSASLHRGDVSVVNMGANERATASVRSVEALAALRHVGGQGVVEALLEFRGPVLEERAGKALSAATMEVLTRVLELVADADEAVDEAQPMLAELMGVPNPDDDEPADEPDAEETVERLLVDPLQVIREQELLRELRGGA